MSFRPIWLRCFVLCMALATVACEEPPTREMNQAQGALDTARAAGAPDYAADEFQAAENALTRSRQAVDEGDFRQALNFALDARDRAQAAARLAADEKARLRTEADRALRDADTALAQAQAKLGAATQVGPAAGALAGPRQVLEATGRIIADARAAFDKGEYRQVLAGLAPLPSQITTASSEIDAALAARTTRRPVRRNR